MEKLKAGMLDEPQIRTLIKNIELVNHMTHIKFENHKGPDHPELVPKMFRNFRRKLGANINKVHLLHSQLDRFPNNLGDSSGEQGH